MSRALWQSSTAWLPRAAVAYQLNSKTVLRGGYGMFADTLNALNQGVDQTGFSRRTSSTVTTDFGMTWLLGDPKNGVSPLVDPFPVRSDGTRFDAPVRGQLGLMAKAGRGAWTYNPFDRQHAWQQRWRVGVQRQIGASMVVEAAYAGSYSDDLQVNEFDASPAGAKATTGAPTASLVRLFTSCLSEKAGTSPSPGCSTMCGEGFRSACCTNGSRER